MTSGGPQNDAGVAAATPTDVELLRAHVDGDTTAFAELVRRHRDRLWAVALRTIGDREEAADAVQDALLSAHRAAERFRGDSAVTTWLHRIVVNACLDRIRRRQAHPTVPLPQGGHFSDGLVTGPEPAAPVQDHDTALVVREALAGLPADQRAAIVLVDVQGYAVAEAAKILDVAEGTIKSRCARGRARMAITLGYLRPGFADNTGQQAAGADHGAGTATASTLPGAGHGAGTATASALPGAAGGAGEGVVAEGGDAGHGNPGGIGRVRSGTAAPSEGRERP